MLYADNKPSDEAIDRVIGNINSEYVCVIIRVPSPHSLITYFDSIDKRRKFSRKRPNDDTGDITYINEKNRVFNKKVEPSFSLCLSRSDNIFFPRSRVTSTNIPRKYARASSAGPHYEGPFYFAWLDRVACYCISVTVDCTKCSLHNLPLRHFSPFQLPASRTLISHVVCCRLLSAARVTDPIHAYISRRIIRTRNSAVKKNSASQ